MKDYECNSLCNLAIKVLLGFLSTNITLIKPCFAQSNIVPDNTLGAEASKVAPNVNVNGIKSELIEGGAEWGQNLFHSLQEFNVGEGRGAYFVVPNDSIQNVLTRVTGSNPSEILGTLGIRQRVGGDFVGSEANLFLINPNGILFGENAKLDTGGSFVGTTANGLQFEERGVFSATNPEAPALLMVNPSALFFNQLNNRGNITNLAEQRGLNGETNVTGGPVGLQVPDGQTLALIGGNLLLDDGNLTAFGGRIEVASVSGAGKVNFDTTKDGLIFNYDAVDDFGEIRLENTAVVDVSAGGGGSIIVTGKDINILGGSSFRAGLRSQSGSSDNKAGNIEIKATAALNLKDGSRIANQVLPEARGKGGNINIIADSLRVEGGAQVSAVTFDEGNGGNLTVNAQDITLIGAIKDVYPSGLFASAEKNSTGDAGNLNLSTNTLLIQDGAQVSAGTFGKGNGGNLTVNAQDIKLIDAIEDVYPSGLFASAEKNSTGDAGNLNLSTNTLLIQDGAKVSAGTSGKGKGGNLTVSAQDIQLIGGAYEDGWFPSSLRTSAEENSTGGAGNLTISTNILLVQDGAQVSAGTFGKGKGGNLTVSAQDVQLIGKSKNGPFSSGLFVSTDSNLAGNAGNLTLFTNTLFVQDGAQVGAGTLGKGKGGDLTINAQDVQIIGRSKDERVPSALFAAAGENSTGDAGILSLSTNTLLVQDGAEVSTSTDGEGKGGNLTVNAQDVRLIGESKNGFFRSGLITNAGPKSTGYAGNLTLSTNKLLVQDGAQVSTKTYGEGKGGDLIVNAQDVRLIGESKNGFFVSGLFANAEPFSKGNAGNLSIKTNKLLVRDGAQVLTGTFSESNGGNLTVNAQDVQLIGESKNGFFGSGLFASANLNLTGNAGNLTISTNTLLVQDGAVVSTSTDGEGKGGNLTVNAQDIQLIGKSEDFGFPSALFASAGPNSTGNAGNLTISTNTLLVQDGSEVSAGTFGEGKGGNLTVNAETLQLKNDATITARSMGSGIAGNIKINVNDDFNADNGQLTTQSQQSSGGNIKITAGKNIFLRNDSNIRTTLSTTTGSGGNINLNANTIVALEDSDILAFAPEGTGGNINFDTRAFLSDSLYRPRPQTAESLTKEELDALDGNNRVDVNATGSISSGTISGQTDPSFLQNSLTELPQNQIDSETLIASSCVVRSKQRNGTFFITGKTNFPYRPGDAVASSYSAVEVQPLPDNTSTKPRRRWKIGDPIVEPSGVYRLANGRSILSRECGK